MEKDSFLSLRQRLMEELDTSSDLSDEEIRDRIDDLIRDEEEQVSLSLRRRVKLRQDLYNSVRRLDVLQELIDDETVTEIMVNGPEAIFVERDGVVKKLDKRFSSREKLEGVIAQIVARCNRVVNEAMPIVDARLENGSRVNVIVSPAALNGPIMTIRRFPDKPMTMERLMALGSLTQECADFLKMLVQSGYSILIGGGTGSGKTTLLGALSEYIPRDERIITIEDNAELKLSGLENLVRLEARSGNGDEGLAISIRDLIRTALRCRPDRIIVGECRGGEAADMITAMNTGHDGSLCTAHANSCRDMLSRLETMILMGMPLPLEAIRRQIAGGLDILIHVGRERDKSRRVMEVAEVTGMEDGQVTLKTLFLREEGKGLCRKASLAHKEKALRAGWKI